jgi:hypothetical protein
MAIARAKLVDLTVTRRYHCVSRCVRKAFSLGEGDHNRREWLENRLEELAEIFAVAVGGYAVMHNHLHVLLRLDPEVAQGWSDSRSFSVGDGCFRLETDFANRFPWPIIAKQLGVRHLVNLTGCPLR